MTTYDIRWNTCAERPRHYTIHKDGEPVACRYTRAEADAYVARVKCEDDEVTADRRTASP